MQSLVAVGLAGLSNIKKSTELMTKATGEYTQALHLINCTLKDGTQCKSDATLAATMLLGMFEVGWVTLFRISASVETQPSTSVDLPHHTRACEQPEPFPPEVLLHPEISYQAEHVQIRETVAQLATEIAESVPFALRLVDNRATEVPSLDHCLGGFTILWPLYVAANTSPLGSTLREWVVERLETIGNDMGIGQAQFMARTIRNTSAPVP
ncbi:unnamed protein product [Aspergillus oryzae var. brunneus]|uniref:Unnamed protein product n=1 Tax=Aspergillus oryzae var. brunneus TaxID=332754 RepID=A0ABQ6KT97_ASPOZ|nr:unnamed protein product [Aspergillus oryzae var. brunneus]